MACADPVDPPLLDRYRIASLLVSPFLKLKDNTPGHYEGFVVDLAEELKTRFNRQFEIHLVPDQQYGHINPETGKWSGLIGYLEAGNADVAIADLTVTEERAQIVDFTTPIVRTGVAILYGSLERSLPFRNFEELVNSNIPYGVVRNGATHYYISHSSDPVMQKAAKYFEEHPESLVDSNSEGVKKAQETRFAFVGEAHQFPAAIKEFANLRQVGDFIFPREFAIALPKDSGILERMNKMLAEFEADGTLEKLRTRWLLQ